MDKFICLQDGKTGKALVTDLENPNESVEIALPEWPSDTYRDMVPTYIRSVFLYPLNLLIYFLFFLGGYMTIVFVLVLLVLWKWTINQF